MYPVDYCYRCLSAGSVEQGVCQICGMEYPSLPSGQIPTASILTTAAGTEVRLRGEIDLASRATIEGRLMKAMEESRGTFLLDLNGVDLLDTQGVHMLLRLQERARELGREFAIRCEGGPCLKVLKIVGLRFLTEAAA